MVTIPKAAKQVNHPAEESATRNNDVTGVMEGPNKRFQLTTRAGRLSRPGLKKAKNAIDLVGGQPCHLLNRVQLNTQKNQNRGRTLAFLDVQRQTKARENRKGRVDVRLTDVGVRGTHGEEIV